MNNETVKKSIYFKQDEILEAIISLHCEDGFECDVTYGNGAFYKNINEPKYKYDLDPQKDGVIKCDSRLLPLEHSSIKSIMFDPPFLTYVKKARDHKAGKVVMTSRFGGYWSYDELEDHYRDTISEAYRVLRGKGIFVMKCQDIIHNHKMHCTHYRSIMMAESEGFRLKDLFILAAKHRMPGPQRGKQRHARVYHSYFLVFESGKK